MNVETTGTAAIDAASHYLWDNWLCAYRNDGLLHRFSLAAPRTFLADDRHGQAAIHHWTSTDGEQWSYSGIAVERGTVGCFDGQAVWSGCAVDFHCCLGLFYTGLGEGAARRQTIAVAFSEDGRRFVKQPLPVLEPSDDAGLYDLGADDGVDMAWRDPFVFQVPGSDEWHMVFSAKRPRPLPRGCFGHAVAVDGRLLHWELRPPIDLPTSYLQMECPAILFHEDRVYCFASTKDRGVDLESESNAAIRAWRAPCLDGPWEPAGEDGRDLVLDHSHQLYAASFVRLPWAGDQVFATGFFSQSHAQAFSWAPLMPVMWTGGLPRVLTPARLADTARRTASNRGAS